MKKFLSILAAVLLWSVCFVPADGAPLKTYILWVVYVVCILWVVRLLWQRIEEEDSASSTGDK